ncbi:serine/threonine-protein kinase [Streptomyces coffeae]|uniref:non-specific serine/threonine protein kinase n=1 Tax=Streptomyces coffeae TaxID=621382 RepID=A0ABS1NEU5_9ACTN|nr:serine/threonine-protein kinase [Streptomyces coffeae]MBL1098566.1 serine/threonine protein kinase [Streptomyces coffeae]
MLRPKGGPLERGELIAGRYELIKRLGRGGMGEVWAGRDRSLRRDVAVKLLALHDVPDPQLALRFEREAVAAAQVNHPNAVALYDRGVHEDALFLIMEKVEGATLAEHIRDESPLSPGRALEIAHGICAALVAAHLAGVIHYDIKPHNVMITPDGQVKVVDFGIAGFIQTMVTVAGSSQLTPAGTPEYGAPEQFLTERGDERSDLYAFGGVLFAMLTGRPPFTGHNALAIVRRKLDEDAPPLASLRPDVPPALMALVAELLAREPRHRPESARVVLERIGRLRTALATGDRTTEFGPAEARKVLLARTAGAMRAVLANADVIARSPRRDILRSERPPGQTSPRTRRLPSSAPPFQGTWTGAEPLSTYTARSKPLRFWCLTVGLSLVAAWLIDYPFRTGHLNSDSDFNQSNWTGFLILGGIVACAAFITFVTALTYSLHDVAHARRRKKRAQWALHVGPHGIVTHSVAGRHEFPWDRIKRVAIEEIPGALPYQFTGVHIDFASGARRPTTMRPAGWIYAEPNTISARANGRTPICVLGPMTERQRTDLMEALSEYGGERWVPSASFASLPIDL